MRQVEGIVCVGRVPSETTEESLLYGVSLNDNRRSWERFTMNNLTPFKRIIEARNARLQLMKSFPGFRVVDLANIKMLIANSEIDNQLLKRKRKLVVLMQGEGMIEILGAKNGKGTRCGYVGELYETNGLEPITTYDEAYYIAQQVNRQAQCGANIAWISLEWFKV